MRAEGHIPPKIRSEFMNSVVSEFDFLPSTQCRRNNCRAERGHLFPTLFIVSRRRADTGICITWNPDVMKLLFTRLSLIIRWLAFNLAPNTRAPILATRSCGYNKQLHVICIAAIISKHCNFAINAEVYAGLYCIVGNKGATNTSMYAYTYQCSSRKLI